MRISELADHVGINPKTIRYYESIGVLPDPTRTDSGYRTYSQDDIERLAFILRARQLDLSLDEIGEILALRDSGQRPCAYVLDVAHTRLHELDQRITEMQNARDELHALLQRTDDLPNNDCYCQLIQHQPKAPSVRADTATSEDRT